MSDKPPHAYLRVVRADEGEDHPDKPTRPGITVHQLMEELRQFPRNCTVIMGAVGDYPGGDIAYVDYDQIWSAPGDPPHETWADEDVDGTPVEEGMMPAVILRPVEPPG